VIKDAIAMVVSGRDLDAELTEAAIDAILSGEATEAQIAALLTGLRMKGETSAEIAAAARVMRRRCVRISPQVQGPLIDTCGTGGDGLDTFNISTAAAIVVAASGVSVAKHGNRAASSKAGSADVLEALGVRIDCSAQQVERCIEQIGIGFLFAPSHHAAMRHAAPVRKQLGFRTLFNILGPLSNPAGATHQVIGVYPGAPMEALAEALGELGVEKAWVVRGHDGLDEMSPQGPTRVAQLEAGVVSCTDLSPSDFGLTPVPTSALRGGDAQQNAEIIRRLLAGEPGPPRVAVLINAAAALCVADAVGSPELGVERAAAAIDSGEAAELLERWVDLSRAAGGTAAG
jgi:anthranilate phosphoribosyltransferase